MLENGIYVDVNVFCTHSLVFLNAKISKTKQQRYGFLFIFRCTASKYICIQKIKNKKHREGQLGTSGFKLSVDSKSYKPNISLYIGAILNCSNQRLYYQKRQDNYNVKHNLCFRIVTASWKKLSSKQMSGRRYGSTLAGISILDLN